MNKPTAAVLTAAILVLLTGCSGSTEAAPSEPETAATVTTDETSAPEEAQKMSAANSIDITAPGEVCDPQNFNDSICAAFYPEQVIANMTSPERAREPLASMDAEQKIELARQACANMDAGSRPSLAETIMRDGDDASTADRNNVAIYATAAMAYCPEHAEGKSAQYIAYYQDLGEAGAKADFADKTMPEL